MNNAQGNLKGYDCKKCKNKGYFYTVLDGIFTAHECECKGVRNDLNRITKSRLGASLERCTFNSFVTNGALQRRMKELALDFTEKAKNRSGKWLFAGGQPGSGKTHICTAVTGELLRSGLNARYIVWNDEAVKIKAKITDFEEYSAAVSPLKCCEFFTLTTFSKPQRTKTAKENRPPPQTSGLRLKS